ncbi:luciferase family protein [Pedobacter sp. KBW06]|uniref:luciferase domain-containing protein n=1 Tax=Pedobacter sp. KBW06 TaxID=2153359 RepID=UPI001F2CA64A|nr:luciferase family protein [Pedobacter sp. KBW06]
MKKDKVFSFVVRHLGFLKDVPLLPHVFDSLLKFRVFLRNPVLLDWLDEIEAEVLQWEGTVVGLHQYGGIQFDHKGKEIGHLHSNGLLDVLYTREMKLLLLKEGRIQPHHVFEKSGWISFYILTKEDKNYAKELLKIAYDQVQKKFATRKPYTAQSVSP